MSTNDSKTREIPMTSGKEEVYELETESRGEWALCLSGGGYRAMLFHAGSLWRLNEAGFLPKLDRISSVSGGSITGAALALAWDSLDFDKNGVARQFEQKVVVPVRKLADETLDVPGILDGLFGHGSSAEKVGRSYREHLFGSSTLQDFPERPRFVINATNVQTGALWRFSRPYMGDWRIGRIPDPKFPVATAVAASSAFPPFLSPLKVELAPEAFTLREGTDLDDPELRRVVYLSDGGVYDNLGLETAWKNHANVLVSDAGGQLEAESDQSTDWLRHSMRIHFVTDNQVRSLRKRQVIASYEAGVRGGTLWRIRTNIAHYELPDTLDAPYKKITALARVPTRLEELPPTTQERLINWGYAVTDAAVRRWVDQDLPKGQFPYAEVGVG